MPRTERVVLSAPGKLVLAGEYAVLHGRRALVAAVSRRVRLSVSATARAATALPATSSSAVDGAVRSPGPGAGSPAAGAGSLGSAAMPPELRLAMASAARRLGLAPTDAMLAPDPALEALLQPSLDVGALLSPGGVKLGLGSSGAGAVLGAAAIFHSAGLDLASPSMRTRVFEAALEGHRAVAPSGSGVDVAASALGGVLSFVRGAEHGAPRVAPERTDAPAAVSVVWSGTPVRTSEFVRAVGAFEASAPAEHRASIARIGDAADAFVDAWRAGDGPALLDATREHHAALGALGEAAHVPIVDDRLARLASLAEAARGALKPSGAGGGDVALAFFPDPACCANFETRVLEEGFDLVPLALGADGAREEAA